MKRRRRIASHQILLDNGSLLTRLSVVEILSGVVTDIYPMTEELPQTEWMPGEIRLTRDAEGQLRAYYNGKIID